ncbi:MAG: tyrosine-type recombinase/integrase [Candidatus Atribacteria bacterium]|nr:tyrosine-type recombinase/integrase [Candidatus Atribacteria bacterium]
MNNLVLMDNQVSIKSTNDFLEDFLRSQDVKENSQRTYWRDIWQSGEAILWVHGEGQDLKDQFVLLTNETLRPINEYLSTRKNPRDEDPLFISRSNRNFGTRLTTRTVSRIVKSSLRKMGLDSRRFSAHSLRHSFATLALEGGAPLLQVKEAMRHRSIETTMIYAHNRDRVKNGAEKYIKI